MDPRPVLQVDDPHGSRDFRGDTIVMKQIALCVQKWHCSADANSGLEYCTVQYIHRLKEPVAAADADPAG